MLPNLIVIGAGKCGTTAFHASLDLHPEIAMSSLKETFFFVEEVNWRRGLAWYESLFDPRARVRGETCPGYTRFPRYRGVPERMAAVVPDAKLVYLVRDPVERTVAAWAHVYADGEERDDLVDAVRDFERSSYVQASRYWFQLERYLEHFPSDRLLVVPQEELRSAPLPTLRRVFGHLGVDESFGSPEFARPRNVSAAKRKKTSLGLVADRAARRLGGERRAMELMARAPRIVKLPFTREFERQRLPESLRTELADYFRPDVERLRAHTGLPLAGWSV